MRNIKEEMMEIKGGEFSKWYKALSTNEKSEYASIIEELRRK